MPKEYREVDDQYNRILSRRFPSFKINANLLKACRSKNGTDISSLLERTVHHATRPERRTVFIEPMSKRRHGFPSETKLKRGVQIVHGEKELVERLGRNDPCPCGSGKRFKKCCLESGRF